MYATANLTDEQSVAPRAPGLGDAGKDGQPITLADVKAWELTMFGTRGLVQHQMEPYQYLQEGQSAPSPRNKMI